MEKEEIISGLRNALDRGYSLDLAVQSFVNAGYSKQDVLDSARVLGYSKGIISNLPPASQPETISDQEMTRSQPQPLPRNQDIKQISQEIKMPEIQPKIPEERYQPTPIQQNVMINLPEERIGKKKSWILENWLLVFLGVILLLLLIGLGLSIFAKQWTAETLKNYGIDLGFFST
jgi:hypothetical protein